jgi:hypothetical protein
MYSISTCIHNTQCIYISALKWLVIGHPYYGYHRPGKDEENSTFLTDAVFVKVLSLMKLEHLAFEVDTARVMPRARAC